MRAVTLLLALSLSPVALAAEPVPSPGAEVIPLGTFEAGDLEVDKLESEVAGTVQVRILARWTAADGTLLVQPLKEGVASSTVEVARDDDAIVLTTGGGAYDPPGMTVTTRYTWFPAAQRFLPGEPVVFDPWTAFLERYDAALVAADFASARQLLARTSPNPTGAADETPELQRRWVHATCTAAADLAEQGQDAEAAGLVLTNLTQPPLTARAPEAGMVVLRGFTLSPAGSGHGMLALHGRPETLDALDRCADALAGDGLLQQAVSMLQAVVAVAPERPSTEVRLADALWALGDEEGGKTHDEAYLGLTQGEQIPPRILERLAVEVTAEAAP